jgi:hypothetical protein
MIRQWNVMTTAETRSRLQVLVWTILGIGALVNVSRRALPRAATICGLPMIWDRIGVERDGILRTLRNNETRPMVNFGDSYTRVLIPVVRALLMDHGMAVNIGRLELWWLQVWEIRLLAIIIIVDRKLWLWLTERMRRS